MRVKALNFRRMFGTSAKTGNPFDFSVFTIETPLEPFSNDKTTLQGFGLDTATIDCDDKVHQNPMLRALTFPCYLELEMDSALRFGRMQTVCTGFSRVVENLQDATREEYEKVKAKS